MPALSPTMESGQISKWNVKTGDQFSSGDVLLTVETDKAEVDVEAQDDGFMGPQLFGPGTNSAIKTIQVGEVIAILGEELEDVRGNLNVPPEWSSKTTASSSNQDSPESTHSEKKAPTNPSSQWSGPPTHLPATRTPKTLLPLSPAVSRILHELGVEDARNIKGTGLRGRLTKGDVLAYFKKASSPTGTAQKMIQADADARLAERSRLKSSAVSKPVQEEHLQLDGPALRRFITEGLSGLASGPPGPFSYSSFDTILEDYYPSSSNHSSSKPNSTISSLGSGDKYFQGLEIVWHIHE